MSGFGCSRRTAFGGTATRRGTHRIVERIAHVPPETVKINLAISTMGLQMMGLRDALNLVAPDLPVDRYPELSARYRDRYLARSIEHARREDVNVSDLIKELLYAVPKEQRPRIAGKTDDEIRALVLKLEAARKAAA